MWEEGGGASHKFGRKGAGFTQVWAMRRQGRVGLVGCRGAPCLAMALAGLTESVVAEAGWAWSLPVPPCIWVGRPCRPA